MWLRKFAALSILAGALVAGTAAQANLINDGTFDGSLTHGFGTFTAGTSATGVWYAHDRWSIGSTGSSLGNDYAVHDNESDIRLFQAIDTSAAGLGAGDEISLSFDYILELAFSGITQRGVEILGQKNGDRISEFLGPSSVVEGERLASVELADSINTFTHKTISATLDQDYDVITVIFRFGAFNNVDGDERGVDNVALVKVPEPATLALFGFGLICLGLLAQRQPKRRAVRA